MDAQVKKKFYTVAEYALLTGDSLSTVRREIRAGNLPYQQSGPRKKIKIPVEALEIRSGISIPASSARNEQSKQIDDPTEKFSGPEPDWMD